MKTVLVIPDGVADEPQPSLNGQTPLQAAALPHMDEVAQWGVVGRTDNVPASMPSGSDVGTMSLFGYDTLKYHTGRAPIEAAAQGIELQPGDVVWMGTEGSSPQVKDGDVIEIEITNVGTLRNPVVRAT